VERRHLTRLAAAFAAVLVWLAVSPASAASDADICANGESDGAVAACTRLISEGRLAGHTLAAVYHRRCVAYNYRNDGERALADCNEAIKADPTYLYGLVDRCWSQINRGQLDLALADCEEAIRRAPNSPGGYNLRALVFDRKGDRDRALADYTQAIKLDPKFPFAYRNRCALYGARNQFDLALADCNEAVRLAASSASFLSTRCYIFNKLNDPRKALEDCTKAIAVNSKWPSAYVNRCESWILKSDPDRAVADCSEAIRLAPTLASSFNNRCWAYNVKRDSDAAIADCNEGIRLNPRAAYTFNHRGNAFRRKDEKGRAIADYSEAIRLDPKYAIARSNRGAVYEEMEKLDLAQADFIAAAQLQPDNAVAKARVQRIEQKIADAAAAGATGGERRVALLIGNGNYAKAAHLPNPKRDTEALAQAFKRVGFAVVTLQQDLSRESLAAALQAFAHEADRADWAVVYYAGHGIEVGGINYLIPVDAKLASDRDVSFETIALDQVLVAVESARKLRLVILDACRDNPFRHAMSRTVASRTVGRGLARVEPEGATLVAFAAKAGQVALDGDAAGNSPFAAALAKHIGTPGLEVNFLFRKVRDEVLGATNRQQEPFTYGSLPAEPFYFRQK
jgi:tetratricopeptide (TPR) repeat protein